MKDGHFNSAPLKFEITAQIDGNGYFPSFLKIRLKNDNMKRNSDEMFKI